MFKIHLIIIISHAKKAFVVFFFRKRKAYYIKSKPCFKEKKIGYQPKL